MSKDFLPKRNDQLLAWSSSFAAYITANAVAVGLVCGLIPAPLQAVAAALACLAFRGNFPLAVITTFYTNPFTIVPLYVVAYHFGKWFVPATGNAPIPIPPDLSFDLDGIASFLHWIESMGTSLAVGLPLLAATLGLLGFITVHVLWRWHAIRAWRRRRARIRARA